MVLLSKSYGVVKSIDRDETQKVKESDVQLVLSCSRNFDIFDMSISFSFHKNLFKSYGIIESTDRT
jgi:hypothetical protein